MSPIRRQALRRSLYPWHRRQKWGWQIAAEVDVTTLVAILAKGRSRKPRPAGVYV